MIFLISSILAPAACSSSSVITTIGFVCLIKRFSASLVLSLGCAILTVRITEAFSLPKLSLFCNVQRAVASLPSHNKLNSKCDS